MTAAPGAVATLRGKNRPVTLIDALRERSPDPRVLTRAQRALFSTLPLGRSVVITAEVLDAMAAGDVALLTRLFAEKVGASRTDDRSR